MIGMLMAVVLYRPIYKKMYALTDTAHQKEIVDLKRIEKSRTVNSAGDSVVTMSTIHIFEDDNTVKQTTTHIIPKSGAKGKEDNKKEVILGDRGFWTMAGLVLIQVVLVTMVYGPIAAFLVELFPTRIRYTSMSLPYHIGNGIFGGLTPFIATSLYESSKTEANPSGDPFAGLWYPIIVAALCFVIGMIFLNNRKVADVVD
jgi:hypothetical protein